MVLMMSVSSSSVVSAAQVSMASVYISVGSNIDPAVNIRSAINELNQYYAGLLISSVYESEAVGFAGDNFYNLVVGFDTDQDVYEVAKVLRKIEDGRARDRKGPKYSSRTIDLDLLLYDDEIINHDGLNIPRDEICQNAFVLWPLAEIAGDRVHPQIGHTFAAMWSEYEKESQSIWPIEFSWG